MNFDFVGTVDFTRLGNLGRNVEFGRSLAIARPAASTGSILGRPAAAPPVHAQPGNHGARDIGGFGLQSNFDWQAVGVYSYAWQFTGYQLAALIGYRALGVNYTNWARATTVIADLVLHGPLSALV